MGHENPTTQTFKENESANRPPPIDTIYVPTSETTKEEATVDTRNMSVKDFYNNMAKAPEKPKSSNRKNQKTPTTNNRKNKR